MTTIDPSPEPVAAPESPYVKAVAVGDTVTLSALFERGEPIPMEQFTLAVKRRTMADHINFPDGRSETHKFMLAHIPVTAVDDMGRTPLHITAIYQDAEGTAQLLRREKALIGAVDNKKRTPLHSAIVSKYFSKEVIQLLLDRNAPMSPDADGNTPWHLAAKADRRQPLQLLIAHVEAEVKADATHKTTLPYAVQNNLGQTVVYLAAVNENLTAINKPQSYAHLLSLCRLGFDYTTPDKKGTTPHKASTDADSVLLSYALFVHDIKHVEPMLKEVNEDGVTMPTLFLHRQLIHKIDDQHELWKVLYDRVQPLVYKEDGSVLLNENDNTLLHEACINGHLPLVTRLLEHEKANDMMATMNDNLCLPVDTAFTAGHHQIAELLLLKSPTTDPTYMLNLYMSHKITPSEQTLRKLLTKEDVSTMTVDKENGDTVYHIAARHQPNLLYTLCEIHPNDPALKIINHANQSVIRCLSSQGQDSIRHKKLLLDNGAPAFTPSRRHVVTRRDKPFFNLTDGEHKEPPESHVQGSMVNRHVVKRTIIGGGQERT